MTGVSIQRQLDPFFIDAVNRVYQMPHKNAFIMDGTIGVGKSTNFTFDAPYDVACHVAPVKEGNKRVRRSTWAIARESENSAVNTLYEIFERSRFPAAILYDKNSPVKKRGINPTIITIQHKLPDNTHLSMTIECYGFRDDKSLGRLKSRSFLGGIAPEMQTMPFDVIELLIERCGGRSAPGMIVQKEINGRMYTLSGADQLTMVFADMNIPPRPHMVYERFYDNPRLEESEYEIITPPSPVIPKPVKLATPAELRTYGQYQSTYRDQKVVWVPNPETYWMTAHYEEAELDGDGNPIEVNGVPKTIPWSGYQYWLKKTVRDESYVNRLIIGKPDKLGGRAAIYKTFDVEKHRSMDGYVRGLPVYGGFDPGLYAGWVFCQVLNRGGVKTVHFFKEFAFNAFDGYTSRQQIEDFVTPYIKDQLIAKHVTITGDPYGKVKTSKGDGEYVVLRESNIKTKTCAVSNQDTAARISNLGYFIEKGALTVNPEACPTLFKALAGGYQWPVSSSGELGNKPSKNVYSHIVEAAQYVASNLYRELVTKNGHNRKSRISKFVSV